MIESTAESTDAVVVVTEGQIICSTRLRAPLESTAKSRGERFDHDRPDHFRIADLQQECAAQRPQAAGRK
jgi:hypothetical protein